MSDYPVSLRLVCVDSQDCSINDNSGTIVFDDFTQVKLIPVNKYRPLEKAWYERHNKLVKTTVEDFEFRLDVSLPLV